MLAAVAVQLVIKQIMIRDHMVVEALAVEVQEQDQDQVLLIAELLILAAVAVVTILPILVAQAVQV